MNAASNSSMETTECSSTSTEPYRAEIEKYIRALPSEISKGDSFDGTDIIVSFEDSLTNRTTGRNIDISETGWKCSVCLGIPRHPISLKTCGHVGCGACIMQLQVIGTDIGATFTSKSLCPVCRAVFNRADVIYFDHWPLFAKQTWAHMRVKCAMCDFVSDPANVVQHELEKCEHRQVSCCGCWFTAPVAVVIEHALQCDRVMVNCVGCGYVIRYTKRTLHSCGKLLYKLRRRPLTRDILSGKKGAVALTMTSADDLYPELDDHQFDAPVLQDRDALVPQERVDSITQTTPSPITHFITPPSTQPPGYPTLSDVSRLANTQNHGNRNNNRDLGSRIRGRRNIFE